MTKKILFIIIGILILSTGAYFLYKTYAKNRTSLQQKKVNIIKPEEHKLYGIKSDNYKTESGYIEPNMFLSTLFDKYNISSKLHNVLEKTKDIFDVRKIKSGQKYTVFFTKDTSETVDYLVYEENKTDYLVFNLKDSVNVYEGKKKVDIKIKETGGVITSNL
ncbi:MAG: hypothetical protein DRI94_13430, partial [Bacteroidetes bacterium]